MPAERGAKGARRAVADASASNQYQSAILFVWPPHVGNACVREPMRYLIVLVEYPSTAAQLYRWRIWGR